MYRFVHVIITFQQFTKPLKAHRLQGKTLWEVTPATLVDHITYMLALYGEYLLNLTKHQG